MASLDNNTAIIKSDLHDWIENETCALDVVASWETLCDVYRSLEFSDPITDSIRMEEFKWIIAEMNKHLSRARKKLLNCPDPESMMNVLESMFSTGAEVNSRTSLTYHKLRQRWVSKMITQLMMMQTEREEKEDGREDFWNA